MSSTNLIQRTAHKRAIRTREERLTRGQGSNNCRLPLLQTTPISTLTAPPLTRFPRLLLPHDARVRREALLCPLHQLVKHRMRVLEINQLQRLPLLLPTLKVHQVLLQLLLSPKQLVRDQLKASLLLLVLLCYGFHPRLLLLVDCPE